MEGNGSAGGAALPTPRSGHDAVAIDISEPLVVLPTAADSAAVSPGAIRIAADGKSAEAAH